MIHKDFSIHDLIKTWSEIASASVALIAPDYPSITYQRLYYHMDAVGESLNRMGIGRNDRVVTIVPSGIEAATLFLTIAARATIAPLNPDYQTKEIEFYLSDLNPRACIVHAAVNSAVRDVARKQGIPVINLWPAQGAEAGLFSLEGEKCGGTVSKGYAQPDDIALLLHTSGTTSRPKLVPLTQENLCCSAHNIQRVLHLVETDRCLNVMPLFHIHGLIAGILSSLGSGGSVICAPGFHAPKFFAWMETFRPTWYTAVPTIHQAVLARCASNQEALTHHSLRFIRSSSSALPPKVMAGLENVFGVPVIEAYGMTEASHQIASNPLPPKKRKAGSVGMAAGPEIAIMDEKGDLFPQDATGEIVIRGSNVMHCYEGDVSINEKSFFNGWFRTGDQGFIDSDGYLFITGRIKEIINRGGEKISPREIDEILMDHPAVAQAVTFALPHEKLGEEVAAAVVLHDEVSITERGLREFVSTRVAPYKVPRHIVFLDAIPKGPTGKFQRIGLAKTLGIAPEEEQDRVPFVEPHTPMQIELAGIWAQVLGFEKIGINDNYFELGGDSVLATQIIIRIKQRLQIDLSMITFFEEPTIARLALAISKNQAGEAKGQQQ